MESGETTLNEVETDKDARVWATFCHVSALLALLGVPLGHLIGPFLVWLLKRNEIPFVEAHGKEALNFQLSMTIYAVGLLVILVIALAEEPLRPAAFIVAGLSVLLFLLDIVLVVVASVRANNGLQYTYPLSIRFIK